MSAETKAKLDAAIAASETMYAKCDFSGWPEDKQEEVSEYDHQRREYMMLAGLD